MRQQRERQRVDWHDSPSQNTRARRCMVSQSETQSCSTQPSWTWLSSTQTSPDCDAPRRFSDPQSVSTAHSSDAVANENAKLSDLSATTPPLLRQRSVKVRKSTKMSPLVSHSAPSTDKTPHTHHRPHLSFSPLLAGKCTLSMLTQQQQQVHKEGREGHSSTDSAVALSPFPSLDHSFESPFPATDCQSPPVGYVKTSTQLPGNRGLGAKLFNAPSPIPLMRMNSRGKRRAPHSPLISASTPKHARFDDDEQNAVENENEHSPVDSLDDSALNELLRAVKTPVSTGGEPSTTKTPLRRSNTFDISVKKRQPRQLVKTASFEHAVSPTLKPSRAAKKDDSWDDDSLLTDPQFLAQIDALPMGNSAVRPTIAC
uniref:Uncharacterized protein n=1 Tax=Plectus sambesii TaxID=2011161 RepID=A0A914XD70_9BILA